MRHPAARCLTASPGNFRGASRFRDVLLRRCKARRAHRPSAGPPSPWRFPGSCAASSLERPAKYRNLTSSAFSGASAVSAVRASLRSRRSSRRSAETDWRPSSSTRRKSPPRLRRPFLRAFSIRIRRMASAAAAKKWRRFSHCGGRFQRGAGRLRGPGRSPGASDRASRGHHGGRNRVQLAVDEGEEFLGSVGIAVLQGIEDPAHGARGIHDPSPPRSPGASS